MSEKEIQDFMNCFKEFIDIPANIPNDQGYKSFELICDENKQKFYLDVDRRGKIEFSKFKLQERTFSKRLPLVRIDIDSPPHQNPDGIILSRNHIHIRKESDGDLDRLAWAYELADFDRFNFDPDHVVFNDILMQFLSFCNINSDNIQIVL